MRIYAIYHEDYDSRYRYFSSKREAVAEALAIGVDTIEVCLTRPLSKRLLINAVNDDGWIKLRETIRIDAALQKDVP